MADQSKAEQKYFLDSKTYNCPFCNIRSISYTNTVRYGFNWDDDKVVYVYFIKCGNNNCLKTSMHLSEYCWENMTSYDHPFAHPPANLTDLEEIDEDIDIDDIYNEEEIDKYFFYHKPTSFFTIDDRIPKQIRELVSEAEGCKEMGYMVGASGALRKSIYKFLKFEKSVGKKYDTKIGWLKKKYRNKIDSDYFSILEKIKDMNDQDMHEQDWVPFKPTEFEELIGALKQILYEVYVEPLIKKGVKERIFSMKDGRIKEKEQNNEIIGGHNSQDSSSNNPF